MSLYEKIATVIIVILVLIMVVFSYHEYKEPAHESASGPNSGFDQSIGADFIIGPYNRVVSSQVSGGLEDNCTELQSVFVGTLHDIKERLEHLKTYTGVEDPFEVNEATLQLLCNKNVTLTLSDASDNTLVLQKIPFVRMVPQNGEQDDIGTEVHINATLVPKGGVEPSQPTTYGDELIPDRFLDVATSSQVQ
ncbi:MAG TPA: hypothetical protein VMR46_00260 [Candidatus Paceibacterota bacterium]|nr:hypothetical protein [Candidatus Paceibacterota bacterium]